MIRAARAFLADAGPARGWWRLVPRFAVVAVVLPAGIGKFANHAQYVDRFERWGFAAPGTMASVTGVVEVLASIAILLGLWPRLGAVTILGVMAGALVTAGRVDGGMNIWLPLVVASLASVVAVGGVGPLRVGRGERVRSRPRRRSEPATPPGG